MNSNYEPSNTDLGHLHRKEVKLCQNALKMYNYVFLK